MVYEPAQLEVNLEMAEISAFSGERREWEIQSRSIIKRNSMLHLQDVEGELYRDRLPPLRLQAETGNVDIDLGRIELATIRLESQEEGTISGESLTWASDREVFLLKHISMDTGTAHIRAGSGTIYPHSGKVRLEEEVEVRFKVAGFSR